MFPLAAIIGIAVASGVGLLVAGALTAVSIERWRHNKVVRDHDFGRGLSVYYGRNLSVDNINYQEIPRPSAPLRRSNPFPEHNGWTAMDAPGPLGGLVNVEPPPKRRKSLRQTLYGHSGNVPKPRKRKKLVKAMPLRDHHRSPLSAITESTDSGSTATGVPLSDSVRHPTFRYPSLQIISPAVLPLRLNSAGHSTNIPRPDLVPRSTSVGSATSCAPSDAPNSPLPPLPITYNQDPSRMSTGSIDTIGSSVLVTNSSPAAAIAAYKQRDSRAALREFDFGPLFRSAPVRQMSNKHQTLYGLTIGQPLTSFHANLIEPVKLDAPPVPVIALTGSPMMPDSRWIQRRKTNRHSMYEHGTVLGTKTLTDCFVQSCEPSVPPRPASIASGNPSQWHEKHERHETRASQPRRGHKRQNCVRISWNLPVRPPSRLSMPQVSEEPEIAQVAPPTHSGRPSLIDIKSSPTPSPFRNNPVFPARPKYVRANSSQSSGIPRPDSDIFSTINTQTPFQSAHSGWPMPLSPTPPTSIKLNRSFTSQPHSPYLPSPVHLHPNGPRAFPSTKRFSPQPSLGFSPAGRRSPTPRQDLRRSIMALRSMNSEFTLDQHLPLTREATMHDLTTIKRKTSTTSIWEDASIRADSPEPSLELKSEPGTATSGVGFGTAIPPRTPTPKLNMWKPDADPEAYENFVGGNSYRKRTGGKGLGFSVAGRAWGTPGSPYDQQGFLKV